ncbi:MAG: class IV adenylate cyclase [Bacilli bacterium]|nr:class IV adenylate cyclase [Bacilli bacterium]
MKVETEKKYYCMQPEILIKMAENLKFNKTNQSEEIDEYFTDINSAYIKNRTCLRIRKIDNKEMEITYKGKSDSLMGVFCKLENNISLNIDDYENCVNLLTSLGYYSYVEVIKNRMTYELKGKKYNYSIMIDSLPEIGGFVEFEIVSDYKNTTKEELKKELNDFVSKFDELKLKESNEPYRDIVAKHLLKKLKGNKDILNLCTNLDLELLRYEKDFYKKYKNEISKVCGSNVKWGEYKKNKDIDKKILPLINKYLENLIFDNNDLLVTIELLYKLPQKKYFFTKVNELFCKSFLEKLNINEQQIIYIKNNDNINSVLTKNNIPINSSIVINNNFKINNRMLLVMINEL